MKIAILGRANVGKSSLFNRLIKKNKALMSSTPGTTIDRLYGDVFEGVTLIDNCGFDWLETKVGLQKQLNTALEEADAYIFVCDATAGVTAGEYDFAQQLRITKKPIILVVNKCEGKRKDDYLEFCSLGLGVPLPISVLHNINITQLIKQLSDLAGKVEEKAPEPSSLRVVILGRPNVGKSSLMNVLCGSERVVVDPKPFTTHDVIDIDLSGYKLMDTPGLRRKSRIKLDSLERLASWKALRTINRGVICVLVVDALDGIVQQDKHLIRLIYSRGAGCIIVVNKWDLIDKAQRPLYRKQLLAAVDFAGKILVCFTSCLYKRGITHVKESIEYVKERYCMRLDKANLDKIKQDIDFLRFIRQIDTAPPTFKLALKKNKKNLTYTMLKRLQNYIQTSFDMSGIPIVVKNIV